MSGDTMAFDYKKEYKEFYMPKNKPTIVDVPKMNYIAVRGKGNPNAEEGEYKQAIRHLLKACILLRFLHLRQLPELQESGLFLAQVLPAPFLCCLAEYCG